MPWIGPAISAGASLLGGAMGSDAAGSAAGAQSDAIGQAMALQKQMYDQSRADLAPYRTGGEAANKRLLYLLGIGGTSGPRGTASMSDFADHGGSRFQLRSDGSGRTGFSNAGMEWYDTTNPELGGFQSSQELIAKANAAPEGPAPNDPAYGSLLRKFSASDLAADPVYQSGLQFGLDQGSKAINERAIANGGYDSGATLKALTRFGNDYGSTKAEGAYNRYNTDQNNIYSRLSGQQTLGQNSAAQSAGQSTAYGNSTANLMTDLGNVNASGIVGKANAMSNAFGGVGSAVQGYQNQSMLNKILSGSRSGSGYATPGYFGGGDFNTDFSQWG